MPCLRSATGEPTPSGGHGIICRELTLINWIPLRPANAASTPPHVPVGKASPRTEHSYDCGRVCRGRASRRLVGAGRGVPEHRADSQPGVGGSCLLAPGSSRGRTRTVHTYHGSADDVGCASAWPGAARQRIRALVACAQGRCCQLRRCVAPVGQSLTAWPLATVPVRETERRRDGHRRAETSGFRALSYIRSASRELVVRRASPENKRSAAIGHAGPADTTIASPRVQDSQPHHVPIPRSVGAPPGAALPPPAVSPSARRPRVERCAWLCLADGPCRDLVPAEQPATAGRGEDARGRLRRRPPSYVQVKWPRWCPSPGGAPEGSGLRRRVPETQLTRTPRAWREALPGFPC